MSVDPGAPRLTTVAGSGGRAKRILEACFKVAAAHRQKLIALKRKRQLEEDSAEVKKWLFVIGVTWQMGAFGNDENIGGGIPPANTNLRQ
jgi:hypothetical protein